MNSMVVKDFVIEYTGGGIYVAYGEFTNGNYFAIDNELLCIYDEDEYKVMDTIEYQNDIYTWQLQHTIDSCNYDVEKYHDVLNQIYVKCNENDKLYFHSLFINIED